jgi:hypothetical protein
MTKCDVLDSQTLCECLFCEQFQQFLSTMTSTFDFCIPTRSTSVPATPDWLHEIKYDGYRLRLERDGDRVRLITKGGYNWTSRYPWIVEAALKNRIKRFVIDGEAVVLGVDGVADFNALHSRRHDDEVQLYAFDILALEVTTCEACRCRCARPISLACWRAGQTASLSRCSNRVRSAPTCFAPPAGWGLKGWSRSVGIVRIRLAGQNIGSRTRTAVIPRWVG